MFVEAWRRSCSHSEHDISVKTALEGIPIISPIASRAPENNHRCDRNNRFDRECRAWQQSSFHICRLLAFSGMAFETDDEESLNLDIDPNEEFLSAFHLAAHLEKRIENYRKSTSIRGSVQKPDQLLDKTCSLPTRLAI